MLTSKPLRKLDGCLKVVLAFATHHFCRICNTCSVNLDCRLQMLTVLSFLNYFSIESRQFKDVTVVKRGRQSGVKDPCPKTQYTCLSCTWTCNLWIMKCFTKSTTILTKSLHVFRYRTWFLFSSTPTRWFGEIFDV